MAVRKAEDFKYEVYDRPGNRVSKHDQRNLADELRTLGSLCLHPLPDYQCLSSKPNSLDDKLLVVARDINLPRRIVAFVSAVYLSVPSLDEDTPSTVLHTGLTCISPHLRRSGLVALLFFHLFYYLRGQPAFASGFWLTSLAEVTSSLGNIFQYASQVYPAPGVPKPSGRHLQIAEIVSSRYRDVMLISPKATFDRETFVFQGANPPGSCFRKDSEDPRFHHRDENINGFYKALLGRNEGNEVLQVGYLDWENIFGTAGQIGGVPAVLAMKVSRARYTFPGITQTMLM